MIFLKLLSFIPFINSIYAQEKYAIRKYLHSKNFKKLALYHQKIRYQYGYCMLSSPGKCQ